MKTKLEREYTITITCNMGEAEEIAAALHTRYRELKDERGYSDAWVTALREARNAFADAVGRYYMGEDA